MLVLAAAAVARRCLNASTISWEGSSVHDGSHGKSRFEAFRASSGLFWFLDSSCVLIMEFRFLRFSCIRLTHFPFLEIVSVRRFWSK